MQRSCGYIYSHINRGYIHVQSLFSYGSIQYSTAVPNLHSLRVALGALVYKIHVYKIKLHSLGALVYKINLHSFRTRLASLIAAVLAPLSLHTHMS